MGSTTEQATARTMSGDGTEIVSFGTGAGPPLLLVHGGAGDHTRWDVLRPYLEGDLTVHAMDRRGRGASGDGPVYELEREFEDVAAVVDAIADEAGTTVDVYGHSYGGLCAFGAAPLTSNIGRLVLYEGWPPVDPEPLTASPDFVARIDALVARGEPDTAIETVLRELVKMTDEEVAAYRAQPSWAARVAAAHTFPREERAFEEHPFSADRAASVTVPTLLLIGEASPDWGPQAETVAAALPDARIWVLEGQGHAADIVAPDLVADRVLSFLRAPHDG